VLVLYQLILVKGVFIKDRYTLAGDAEFFNEFGLSN
jgi:hypothetical protein